MKPLMKILICLVVVVICASLMLFLFRGNYDLPVLSFGRGADKGYTVGDKSGTTTVKGEIKGLDIDWSSGSISVHGGDVDQVTLIESAQEKENSRLRYKLDGGILKICERSTTVSLFSSFSKDLEIVLPLALAQSLTSVEVDCASADIRLMELTADKVDIDTASGDITATGDYRSFEIETASGEAELNCSILYLEFDSASGDLTLNSSVAPEKMDVSTASGSSYISIPADAQFTLNYDTASGEQTIDGFAGSLHKEQFICGDGSGDYSFDTASGDVSFSVYK